MMNHYAAMFLSLAIGVLVGGVVMLLLAKPMIQPRPNWRPMMGLWYGLGLFTMKAIVAVVQPALERKPIPWLEAIVMSALYSAVLVGIFSFLGLWRALEGRAKQKAERNRE